MSITDPMKPLDGAMVLLHSMTLTRDLLASKQIAIGLAAISEKPEPAPCRSLIQLSRPCTCVMITGTFENQLSMCNEIVVLSRMEAEEFECSYAWGCISITTTEDDPAEITDENRIAILRLVFADITQHWKGFILFDDEHAYDILDFVTHHWDAMQTLMIHCDAGISRSSAVAAAISRLKFGTEGEFLYEPFNPNPLVYRTIREVATGRADYQDTFDEDEDWYNE